jgi:hypothetical protein
MPFRFLISTYLVAVVQITMKNSVLVMSQNFITIGTKAIGTKRYKKSGLWIRIGSGFSDFVDPDPYWESGSRIRIQRQEN